MTVVASMKIPHLQSCCTLLQKNSKLQPEKLTSGLRNYTLPMFAHTFSDTSRFRLWCRAKSCELLLIHITQRSCDVPQQLSACANNSKAEKADLVQARKSACKASEYVKDSRICLSLPQLRSLWLFQMTCESFAILHIVLVWVVTAASWITPIFKNSDLTARQAYIIWILMLRVQRDHAVHRFKIFQPNAINLCWASERESSLSCLQRKVWPPLQAKMTFYCFKIFHFQREWSISPSKPLLLSNLTFKT